MNNDNRDRPCPCLFSMIVGIWNAILLITLGSYLVALTNCDDCLKLYETGCGKCCNNGQYDYPCDFCVGFYGGMQTTACFQECGSAYYGPCPDGTSCNWRMCMVPCNSSTQCIQGYCCVLHTAVCILYSVGFTKPNLHL